MIDLSLITGIMILSCVILSFVILLLIIGRGDK